MATQNAINPDVLVDWPIRLATIVIDIIAIYLFAFVLMLVIVLISSFIWGDNLSVWMSGLNDAGYNIIGVLFMSVYYIAMELTLQRTIGKYITGTMVVMEDGTKPQARAIVIRTFCRFLPFEVLSFLRSYPRGWHDSAAGVYIVNAKKFNEELKIKNSFSEIGTIQDL